MKHFLLFAVIAAIVPCYYGVTMDELAAMIAKDQDECFKKAPVSAEITKKVSQNEMVADPTLKKYALCMQTLIGFMNADGTYNVDSIKHTVSEIVGNNQYDKLVEMCASNQGSDAAENAWNLALCANANVHNDLFLHFARTFWSLPF